MPQGKTKPQNTPLSTAPRRENVAVILAGGAGTRMGGPLPKQLLTVAGRTVMEHTVNAFEHHPSIDSICLVVRPSIRANVERLVSKNAWRKVESIVEGGSERSHSSLAAIRAYEGRHCNLLFHDAVRLLVSSAVISRVCGALEKSEAVTVAIPSNDTLIEVLNGRVVSVPDRSRLRRTQTPQAFRREVIARAYELAMADPSFRATDDSGVLLHYLPQVPIAVVEGEERNLKLTHPEDIPYVEHLMRSAQP